jgi:hypothetical protein
MCYCVASYMYMFIPPTDFHWNVGLYCRMDMCMRVLSIRFLYVFFVYIIQKSGAISK